MTTARRSGGRVGVLSALGAAAALLASPAAGMGHRDHGRDHGSQERSREHRRDDPRVPSVVAPRVDPIARAKGREELMAARAAATERRARGQALVAYRLSRRRRADFLGDPARRAETARALEAAVLVLRRSAVETTALRRELGHARDERAALESGSQPVAVVAPLPGNPDEDAVNAPDDVLTLVWPARGALVAGPGRRRDPATGTEIALEGLEILSRMNEPVRAVTDGRVRKVAALPQGGHAIVIEHAPGRLSILTGLRAVEVAPGAEVKAGDTLGLVGRDLDGAPVLGFELWQDGVPIDPRPWLPAR